MQTLVSENGGKPKMEALAEVSGGHDHTAL